MFDDDKTNEVWLSGIRAHTLQGRYLPYNGVHKGFNPAILSVSRQTYQEAVPVLYGCKLYDVSTSVTFKLFLETIGTGRAYLRRVRLRGMAHDVFCQLKIKSITKFVAEAKHLQYFELDLLEYEIPVPAEVVVKRLAPVFEMLYAREKDVQKAFDVMKISGRTECGQHYSYGSELRVDTKTCHDCAGVHTKHLKWLARAQQLLSDLVNQQVPAPQVTARPKRRAVIDNKRSYVEVEEVVDDVDFELD